MSLVATFLVAFAILVLMAFVTVKKFFFATTAGSYVVVASAWLVLGIMALALAFLIELLIASIT